MITRTEKTLADTYCEDNRFELAIESYNEEILNQPNSSIAWHNRGFAKYKLSQLEFALSDYTQAINLNESDQTYRNRSIVLYRLGRYGDARTDVKKLVELNPRDADAYNKGGDIFTKEEKYEHAIWAYTEAIKIDPNNSHAYYNRAIANSNNIQYFSKFVYPIVKSGKLVGCSSPWYKGLKGCELDLEKYKQYEPNICFTERPDFESAVSDLSQFIILKPKDFRGYYLRGYYYSSIDFNDKKLNKLALKDFNKCLELDPFYFPAYEERTKVFAGQKNYKLTLDNLAYINEEKKRGEILDGFLNRPPEQKLLTLNDEGKWVLLEPDEEVYYLGDRKSILKTAAFFNSLIKKYEINLESIYALQDVSIRIWVTQTWCQLVMKKDIDGNPVEATNLSPDLINLITTYMLGLDSNLEATKTVRNIECLWLRNATNKMKLFQPKPVDVPDEEQSDIVESRYQKRIGF